MVSTFKSCKSLLVALVFLFTTVFSSLGSVASAATTSDFTQLNATQVVKSMGAGINVGNTLDAHYLGIPNEEYWGSAVIQPGYFKKAKAEGFKTIRIPVTFMKYIGPAPNYSIDANWLARVKQVVDYAYNEGLYVIINIHHDGAHSEYGWLYPNAADQTAIKAKYQKFWQQIANTFKDYNEHLIFESMNEVGGTGYNPDAYSYTNLNAYNQIFVDTVRQTGSNNAARWLLVPGWYTDINFTANNYGFVLPTDNYRASSIPSWEKRIIVSVHYYDPYEFCLGESASITQWGATADPVRKDTWGQEDYMDSRFKLMYDKFVTQGYPVVIGEFSAADKSGSDPNNVTFRELWYKAVVSTAKKYNLVPVTWDTPGGLIDRANYTVSPNSKKIINAIMGASGTYYKIVNRNSGKALDIKESSTADGAAAIQFTYNYGNNQQWELLDIGGGYVEIINRNSGKSLEIGGWSTDAGAAATQWTYGGRYSYNQHWQIIDAGGGYVKLKNRNSGMLLDISGGNTGDGGVGIQWPDINGTNQQWQLVQL
jgi:endoglucanase